MTKTKMLSIVNSMKFTKFLDTTSDLPKTFIKSSIGKKSNNNQNEQIRAQNSPTLKQTLHSFHNKRQEGGTDLVLNNISKLLQIENVNYLDCSFLFFIDPVKEEKVNAEVRDKAIKSIQILNKIYYEVPSDIFIKSVVLIDRFITRVKVKPKYIDCVCAACFYIATRMLSKPIENCPTLESLNRMSKCGGSVEDLERMTEIILIKLNNNLEMVTSYDFLLEFYKLKKLKLDLQSDSDDNWTEIDSDWLKLVRDLELSQSNLRICWQRPALIGLACLVVNCKEIDLALIRSIAIMCKLDLTLVSQTAELMRSVIRSTYTSPTGTNNKSSSPNYQSSRSNAFVWVISKRTLSNIYTSSPTSLSTIDEEENDTVECGDQQGLIGGN